MAIDTATERNRALAYGLGAVYLLVGAVGFAITGGTGFASTHGEHLLGIFEVNPLHNVVHLLVGALLVLAARNGERAAASVNTLVGAVYLAVGVLGLVVGDSDLNILALNPADHVLHFGSAIVLLAVGLSGNRRRVALDGR